MLQHYPDLYAIGINYELCSKNLLRIKNVAKNCAEHFFNIAENTAVKTYLVKFWRMHKNVYCLT